MKNKHKGGKDTKLYGMMIFQGFCRIKMVDLADRNLAAIGTIVTRYVIKPLAVEGLIVWWKLCLRWICPVECCSVD